MSNSRKASVPQSGPTFIAERRGGEHECNVYCRENVHAQVLYTDGELPEGTVAIIAGGRRSDIVDIRPAPEVPPIDPTDPSRREWSHRWLVFATESDLRLDRASHSTGQGS